MQEDRSFAPIVAAVVLAVLGVVLLFSVLGSARGEYVVGPGAFLFTAFHWASLFVPAYLLISACLLLIRPFRRFRLLILTLSVVPFLTFASILKTLFENETTASPLTQIILAVFGRVSGTLVQTIVLTMEIVLIWRLRTYLYHPDRTRGREEGHRVFHPNLQQEVAPRPKGRTNDAEAHRIESRRSIPIAIGEGDVLERDLAL